MVKLPARVLAAFALAGLVFAIIAGAKIGSAPAQDVAPPSGSSPPSSGGAPGVSTSSPGSIGSGQTVSSGVNPTEPGFEWTLERMLLAVPMPMTQEERTFLSQHPPLEKIRDWTQQQFDSYVSTDLGGRQVAQEGVRWRELVVMLKRQQQAGFVVLKKKAPVFKHELALPKAAPGPLDNADSDQFQKSVQQDSQPVFVKMKQWRQEVADLAASVESMRKEAERKGLGDRFNEALSASP